jgi:tetratricopeptide (TPR) repeat protein
MGLALAASVAAFVLSARPSADELLREATRALKRGEYSQAAELAGKVRSGSAEFAKAQLVLGESATKLKRFDDALQHYAAVPDDGGDDAVVALVAAGDLLLHRGQLTEAEGRYRRALMLRPEMRLPLEQLVALLGIEGRRWESAPHLLELLRRDAFTIQHLVLLGDLQKMVQLDEAYFREHYADRKDPAALIGLARVAMAHNRPESAEDLLREVLAAQPHQIEAHVRLGELILRRDAADEFLQWHGNLPPAVDDHPDVWVLRARWAQEHDQPRVATRCLWEALRRDPQHAVAAHQLGRAFMLLGRTAEAEALLAHAQRLRGLSTVVDRIYTVGADLDDLRQAAELTESLGRFWEAWGWTRAALANRSDLAWARSQFDRLHPVLTPDLPQTSPDHDPARRLDLSDFPLPNWSGPSSPPRIAASEAAVRFDEITSPTGIDFAYFNDPDAKREGWRMFQFTGGGVGALDYDGDGWPDLYFPQGCRWPGPDATGLHLDRLYRNLGGALAADVTAQARLFENGFSQGVAAGDFDNDGFADVYVANVGTNRLYHNNGDGTFSDVTLASGIRGDAWTTSALIADLNGDAAPEIYDVNFLTGDDVFDRVCFRDGAPRSCPPTAFPAAEDQLFASLGDGRFLDVTSSSGIIAPDGNGLGIVAADFEETGRLNLFVANDSVPNFYFVNGTSEPGGDLLLKEQAQLLGVAVDQDGLAQACMGVGADDADGDGRLDLFVTNFFNEANTLYRQVPGHLFVDGTRAAGLREPSLTMLGFGTQFLDGDLDGWPDLVVTNGHVDDFTHNDIPYHMPPQFFRNLGDGAFMDMPRESLGAFFQRDYLGRGLAKLDWNRDGREDFAVSHLDSPAALVANATRDAGHFIAVRLIGTHGSRDAIGAIVRVTAGGRTWTKQLTAGDGYMATNQRQIVFGLGSADRVETLSIRWLNGRKQEFHDLAVDHELQFVEGRRTPLTIPH